MEREKRRKTYNAFHDFPDNYWAGFILLPYGNFYEKTKVFVSAKKGDTLRFFNGPEFPIEKVLLIDCDELCDALCSMRYGVPWSKALETWKRYARMEGHDAAVLSSYKCLIVFYDVSDKL